MVQTNDRKDQEGDPMSFFEGSRVLITGGSGFIGSHLIKRLIHLGANNIVVLHRGTRMAVEHARVIDVVCNLVEPLSVATIKALGKFDFVFNLAGISEQEMPHPEPWRLLEGNVTTLMHVTKGISWEHVKGAVHMGTTAEYGNQVPPFREDMQQIPTNVYGWSKAAATLYATMMAHSGFASWCVARQFTGYGMGHCAGFIYDLACALNRNETFVVKSAEVTRDFIFINDTIEGILRLAVCQSAQGEIVNLCSGKEISIGEIAQTIQAILKKGAIVLSAEHYREGEFVRSWGSNEKLEQLTGWKPATELKKGLTETLLCMI